MDGMSADISWIDACLKLNYSMENSRQIKCSCVVKSHLHIRTSYGPPSASNSRRRSHDFDRSYEDNKWPYSHSLLISIIVILSGPTLGISGAGLFSDPLDAILAVKLGPAHLVIEQTLLSLIHRTGISELHALLNPLQ